MRSASATTVPGAPTSSTTGAPTSVVVHVAGAVAKPGVVTLPAARRVVDAIAALGRPGLRAMGSVTGHGHVVAIESDNLADAIRGRGIVRLIDPGSRRLDHDQPETSTLRGAAFTAPARAAC